MRRPLASLADRELARIYIAGTLAEAERVEAALEMGGIDYAVEIEPYLWHLLDVVPSEHRGAAFYVLAGQATVGRERLRSAGMSAGLVDE